MIQGEESITASSLVQIAAEQYGISSTEYLTSMRDESVCGGGPEIIALASELQRQVILLEPETNDLYSDGHFLKIRARLGDDHMSIYILYALINNFQRAVVEEEEMIINIFFLSFLQSHSRFILIYQQTKHWLLNEIVFLK